MTNYGMFVDTLKGQESDQPESQYVVRNFLDADSLKRVTYDIVFFSKY